MTCRFLCSYCLSTPNMRCYEWRNHSCYNEMNWNRKYSNIHGTSLIHKRYTILIAGALAAKLAHVSWLLTSTFMTAKMIWFCRSLIAYLWFQIRFRWIDHIWYDWSDLGKYNGIPRFNISVDAIVLSLPWIYSKLEMDYLQVPRTAESWQ